MRDLVLDFETFYGKDYSLGSTKMTTMAYIMDPRFKIWGVGLKWLGSNEPAQWYSEDEAETELRSIDWTDVNLICHNTHFDAYILNQRLDITPAFYSDTAAMLRALEPNSRAGLKEGLIRHFPDDPTMRKGEELESFKDIRDLTPEQDAILGGYCVNDVEMTEALYRKLVTQIPESERYIMNVITRMFVEPRLFLDIKRITAFRDSEAQRAEQLIEASGIPREVLASNKQFMELLEEMEIDVPFKLSPTALAKGEEVLIPALGKNDIAFQRLKAEMPEHKELWDARTAAKSRINETRAQRFLDAVLPDGRIPMPLKYSGAHTHRLAGTEKMNVQNMTRKSELRYSLIADEDQYVYVGDLSQIEARLNAWLASEDELLAAFARGEDIYSLFASDIYGWEVTKANFDERMVGKTSILGLGYQMGAPKFRDTLMKGALGPPITISMEEAMRIVRLYRTKYSRIAGQWETAKGWLFAMLDRNRWGETYGPLTFDKERIWGPNGLALHYPNLRIEQGKFVYDTHRGRKTTYGGNLVENIIQFLARIVIMEAVAKSDAYFLNACDVAKTRGKGGFVLQVHDENICIGPRTNAEEHMKRFLEILTTPPEWCHDAPLAAEGGYDVNYSK